MNVVVLAGRLTRDPEIRHSAGGTPMADFTLAVERSYKKEGYETADFIRCRVIGGGAEVMEKYFVKGKPIMIQGEIQTFKVEKDGETKWFTEVLVSRGGIHFALRDRTRDNSDGGGYDVAVPLPDGGGADDDDVPF